MHDYYAPHQVRNVGLSSVINSAIGGSADGIGREVVYRNSARKEGKDERGSSRVGG